jgi:2-polyprenyl-3-methyl-5-hydroxy-6-metoxy-1,4-benzoquinol methylase
MDVAYQGNADTSFLRGIDFEIVKCRKCHFAFQKNVFKDQKLNDLYNKWIDPKLAEEWHNDRNTFEESLFYIRILVFAKNYHNKPSAEIKVLDFGAGFGEFLAIAQNMGFQSYALEYSAERIRVLQNRGIPVIDYNESMSFDLIVVNQVLEHLTDPAMVLRDIYSRLNSNGIAFLAVPNCPKIERQLKRTTSIVDGKEMEKVLLDASVTAFQHVNFFNNANFGTLIRNCGFQVIFDPYFGMMSWESNYRSFVRLLYRVLFQPSYYHLFRTTFFVKKKI